MNQHQYCYRFATRRREVGYRTRQTLAVRGAREENRTPDLRITSATCSDSGGRVGTFAIVKAKSFGCVLSVWTSVDIS
jgi:hypothetical protein